MFTEQQTKELSAPLSKEHVKSRSQAGRELSYIEGWHAIAEANRIFGYDAWDRELTIIKELGEPRLVDGKHRVAYMATVRVTVRTKDGEVVRVGAGYGSGIDKDVGSAHESALKEAETDAMKRALMTFGNPFGLALYDKTQANVCEAPQPEPEIDPSIVTYLGMMFAKFASASTTKELDECWREEIPTMNSLGITKKDKSYTDIVNEFARVKTTLKASENAESKISKEAA